MSIIQLKRRISASGIDTIPTSTLSAGEPGIVVDSVKNEAALYVGDGTDNILVGNGVFEKLNVGTFGWFPYDAWIKASSIPSLDTAIATVTGTINLINNEYIMTLGDYEEILTGMIAQVVWNNGNASITSSYEITHKNWNGDNLSSLTVVLSNDYELNEHSVTGQTITANIIQRGYYYGAVRRSEDGDVNFYFANEGLLGYIYSHPQYVERHLDSQIRLFYRDNGETGADALTVPCAANPIWAEANWKNLHSDMSYTSCWSGDYVCWQFDINADGHSDFYHTTPIIVKTDSHDSYASTFLTLATKYAESSTAGAAWFAANLPYIKNCLIHNYKYLTSPIYAPITRSTAASNVIVYGNCSGGYQAHRWLTSEMLSRKPQLMFCLGNMVEYGNDVTDNVCGSAYTYTGDYFYDLVTPILEGPINRCKEPSCSGWWPLKGDKEFGTSVSLSALAHSYFMSNIGDSISLSSYLASPTTNSCYYTFVAGNIRYVVLDTNISFSAGTAQGTWFQNAITGTTYPIIVLSHASPLNYNWFPGMLTGKKVKLVISASTNGYAKSTSASVTYITTGGGGDTLNSPSDEYHYIHMTPSGGPPPTSVTIRAITNKGDAYVSSYSVSLSGTAG